MYSIFELTPNYQSLHPAIEVLEASSITFSLPSYDNVDGN